MPELLLGCGNSRDKRFAISPNPVDWTDLTTLDIDETSGCDVVFDLDSVWQRDDPLPFPDDHFTEVHAYEVLEHLGQQGDVRSFFGLFSEIWRVLTPAGRLYATVPLATSPWAWGDPGHRRIISLESLTFLSQAEYTNQVGITPMTDYRWCYDADFQLVAHQADAYTLIFVVEAVKPSRKE